MHFVNSGTIIIVSKTKKLIGEKIFLVGLCAMSVKHFIFFKPGFGNVENVSTTY